MLPYVYRQMGPVSMITIFDVSVQANVALFVDKYFTQYQCMSIHSRNYGSNFSI